MFEYSPLSHRCQQLLFTRKGNLERKMAAPIGSCRPCFIVFMALLLATSATKFASVAISGLGTCKGLEQTVLNKSVDVFKGIPYVKAPVGQLRFKAPEPITWSGVRNSTEFGAVCPQTHFTNAYAPPIGKEDCLTLNIYRPNNVTGKLAVMVWIHGGAFISGSGHEFYDGSVLAVEYNVIVVTLNYRIGILGFFNIPGTETKGNYAMLDQVAALRWVKKNIPSFGGDADKITIFGESAGAASVSLHTVSPLARNENLFKRAIIQSGSASCPWSAYNTKSNDEAKKLGVLVGCTDVKTMTECLRGKPVNKILAAQAKIGVSTLTGPQVDGNYLKSVPWELANKNAIQVANVEQLIGFNKDEGRMFGGMYRGNLFALKPQQTNKTTFEDVIKYATVQRYPGKQDKFHKTAIYEYTKFAPEIEALKWYESTADFYGDFYFIHCTRQFAHHLAGMGKTVYRYKYTYLPKRPVIPLFKVAHSMELGLMFGSALINKPTNLLANYTDEDKLVSRNMMKMWTDFAKNGNPGNNWPKYTTSKREYMEIGLNLTVKRDSGTKKTIFWNELVPQLVKVGSQCDNNLKSWAGGLNNAQWLIASIMAFATILLLQA